MCVDVILTGKGRGRGKVCGRDGVGCTYCVIEWEQIACALFRLAERLASQDCWTHVILAEGAVVWGDLVRLIGSFTRASSWPCEAVRGEGRTAHWVMRKA